jgi:hypothetical protein
MTLAEIGLLIGMLVHIVGMVIALVKLVAWISAENATAKQRLMTLEYQVNNDVTGRRVVGEMRADMAAIKAQISDIKTELGGIHRKLDGV